MEGRRIFNIPSALSLLLFAATVALWMTIEEHTHRHVGRGEWVLLSAILPVLWLISQARTMRKQQRLRRGLCLTCGYDLRASKERCPECGTPIPADVSPVGAGKAGSTAKNT